MTPHKENLVDGIELRPGDCFDVVRGLADASIDSVVTDPPYALVSIVKRFGAEGAAPAKGAVYARASAGFMGKQWDTGETAFAAEFWAEVLRVLKPGGHVAAFGGTRSYHRLACAIEDAGFEIRDQLAWTYGSGFPKSHDVSKGIDKAAGAEREIICANPNKRLAHKQGGAGFDLAVGASSLSSMNITAPATDAARQWEGWGTALKPAWEPICLARKPLSEKTVAANVLRWGTGAINVDGCRVGDSGATKRSHQEAYGPEGRADQGGGQNWRTGHEIVDLPLGRWPANLCHDGSPEVLAAFPESKGQLATVGPQHGAKSSVNVYGDYGPRDLTEPRGDSGSAARFFYCAKASKADRAGSKHPTVKPVKLMQWLVRLITPPGGTVLDPFAGTGTTGEACHAEGCAAVLIEREAEYQADIRRRMARLDSPRECGINSRSNQISIFDLCELEA